MFSNRTPYMNRVGLLGGSFNPPHAGHKFIAIDALKRFQLDEVWFAITTHNPLKTEKPLTMSERVRLCKRLTDKNESIKIIHIDELIGSSNTIDLLKFLQNKYPKYQFYWLMGSDNLTNFHMWDDWHKILDLLPIVVYDRPQFYFSHIKNQIHKTLLKARVTLKKFKEHTLPAWVLIKAPTPDISSTEIRKGMKN